MREIYRTIASALIFSKDDKLLMGKKDPKSGGVYLDYRHIPGGGVNKGESLKQAVIREVKEEIGLDISSYKIIKLPYKDIGISEKTIKETGEKVLCHMTFNRFKIILDKNSNEINLILNDDLIETKWFNKQELLTVKQVPGGKELLEKINYI